MDATQSTFLGGVVGFAAYEAIRLFRIVRDTTSDRPPWRPEYTRLYIVLLPCLAVLSGAIALMFEVTSMTKAVAIGYLAPSGLGSLLGRAGEVGSATATVGITEEIKSRRLGRLATLRRALRDYFS